MDGMKAYTNMIQEKEMEEGCEVVKHQAVRCHSRLTRKRSSYLQFLSSVVWC